MPAMPTSLPRSIARTPCCSARAAGPDVLLSSGFADFTLPNGTVLPFRLTLAFVKVDGKWLVAQHHGSPVPK